MTTLQWPSFTSGTRAVAERILPAAAQKLVFMLSQSTWNHDSAAILAIIDDQLWLVEYLSHSASASQIRT